MSGSDWGDPPIDPDVVAFMGGLRELGDRLGDATADSGDQIAAAIREGLTGLAESVQWLAHATDPVRVPCPHRHRQHKQEQEGG